LKIWNIASRLIERSLLIIGILLLGVYGSLFLRQEISSRFALWQFKKTVAAQEAVHASSPLTDSKRIDFSLWAQKRIQAYQESLLKKSDPPLAVLDIAKIQIRVPVFDGTDDLTLNRGVGRITGTAMPGTLGNVGIAGHRDGFFRGLKDIALGDAIDLITAQGKATYVVDEIRIVSPSDVDVLQPRSVPSLTLVTCYPFYFVGDAPKRFIVQAFMAPAQVKNHFTVSTTRINTQEGRR
jgi:sortase A